jgi:5S rRNA maturation endonuclease (ribonuclease M5)
MYHQTPGSLLKKHIPIDRSDQWDETRPGFLEADTASHCGTSMEGMFVFTVNCIDIATGWREQRAIWGKGEYGVLAVIKDIEQKLPLNILGFDCDNGGEFLNWRILKYFKNRKTPVHYTCSRPYHKNDNHVEEKKLDNRSPILRLSASCSTTSGKSNSMISTVRTGYSS